MKLIWKATDSNDIPVPCLLIDSNELRGISTDDNETIRAKTAQNIINNFLHMESRTRNTKASEA